LFPLSNSFRKGEIKGVSENSASLTQFLTHLLPLSFEKERGDANNFFPIVPPSLTLLERGNKKGVSKKIKGR
jgi:hypothetical protein